MRVSVRLVAAVLTALVATEDVAAQHLAPHVLGWERYFAVSWEAFERGGRPHLGGYVANQYGASAWQVQLLVEGLDSSGQIVAQRIEWLGGDVGPFSRRYFEVSVPGPDQAVFVVPDSRRRVGTCRRGTKGVHGAMINTGALRTIPPGASQIAISTSSAS